MQIQALLNTEIKKFTPITKIDQGKVYTFADANEINMLKRAEEKLLGSVGGIRHAEYASGGKSLAKVHMNAISVDEQVFFANRMRRVEEAQEISEEAQEVPEEKKKQEIPEEKKKQDTQEEKKKQKAPESLFYIDLVIDYRAIKEQSSGKVYTDNVLVYRMEKTKKGEVILHSSFVVSADEFIQQFKHKLAISDMKKVFKVIRDYNPADIPEEGL
ncbi:hypothetical protein FACS189418_6810 [Clostridia bacterium]|nr:hypothetical protein FACS189418_6810 [Clostridia bacterium]